MKKYDFSLGILGLGSRSTLFYITQLNKNYHAVHGADSTCPFLLLNTDFNTLNPFLPSAFKELKANLIPYFKELKRLPISTLIIPNITLHETVDLLEVESNFQYALIHPIESTLNELKKNNIKEVVLFGSLYSMKSSYITQQFKDNSISVTLPTENEMIFIDTLRHHIYHHTENSNDLIRFRQLIQSYSMRTNLVISCTELSLVLDKITSNVYDMARIQLKKALISRKTMLQNSNYNKTKIP
jgi:aspartate racemase